MKRLTIKSPDGVTMIYGTNSEGEGLFLWNDSLVKWLEIASVRRKFKSWKEITKYLDLRKGWKVTDHTDWD